VDIAIVTVCPITVIVRSPMHDTPAPIASLLSKLAVLIAELVSGTTEPAAAEFNADVDASLGALRSQCVNHVALDAAHSAASPEHVNPAEHEPPNVDSEPPCPAHAASLGFAVQ
jgi:hypothetical protein